MADWTTLDTNSLLPGEPWTSAKSLAVYENTIAAFEVALDAPRLAKKFRAGEGSTVDFSIQVDDGYEGLIIEFTGIADSDSTDKFFVFALSDDDGASYSADESVNIGQSADGTTFQAVGKIFIDLTTGDYWFLTSGIPTGGGGAGTGTAAKPAGTVDRIIFRSSVATSEMRQAAVLMELTGKEAAS